MIEGFEDITAHLDSSELLLVPMIVNILSSRIGKKKAIKNKDICAMLNEQILVGKPVELQRQGYVLRDAILRKLIHHIRCSGELPLICSTSQGYFVAASQTEAEKYIKGLKERISQIQSVANALIKQCQERFNPVQGTMFFEAPMPELSYMDTRGVPIKIDTSNGLFFTFSIEDVNLYNLIFEVAASVRLSVNGTTLLVGKIKSDAQRVNAIKVLTPQPEDAERFNAALRESLGDAIYERVNQINRKI